MSNIVITGIGSLRNPEEEFVRDELSRLSGGMAQVRLVNDIEKISVAAAGRALADAGILSPVGNGGIGIYAGIDEGIDGIKFRYYNGVLREGPLGASPALFPFTSPNAISAQIAIALDMRGECITFPDGILSDIKAVGYAAECVRTGKTAMALAGGSTQVDEELKLLLPDMGYGAMTDTGSCSGFLVLETDDGALRRGARVYGEILWSFDMFKGAPVSNDAIDGLMESCIKETGIESGEIGLINLVTSEGAFPVNSKIKTTRPFALSASSVLIISDYLGDSNPGGALLLIASDRHGNISALLIKKS